MRNLDSAMRALSDKRINQAIMERVDWFRTTYGQSTEQMARVVGVDHDTYLAYEVGRKLVPAASLSRLAVMQDQPIAWFYQSISHIPESICTCNDCGGLVFALGRSGGDDLGS